MTDETKSGLKAILILIGAWVAGNWLWDKISPSATTAANETSSDTTTTVQSSSTDLTPLIAAVNGIASLINQDSARQSPPLRTVSLALPGISLEIPCETSTKRICVAAYAVTGPQDIDLQFWNGNTGMLWRLQLNSVAGNSGANLASEYPVPLFMTDPGSNLQLRYTGTNPLLWNVSLTYWLEG